MVNKIVYNSFYEGREDYTMAEQQNTPDIEVKIKGLGSYSVPAGTTIEQLCRLIQKDWPYLIVAESLTTA
jgi:hypothetical protein